MVVGFLGWLFATPPEAKPADLVKDLQQGVVDSYEVGSLEDFKPFRGLGIDDPSDSAGVVVWCASPLRCKHVQIDDLIASLPEDDGLSGVGPAAEHLDGAAATDAFALNFVQHYAAANVPPEQRTYPWLRELAVVWPVVWLVMLFVLVTGPQPRRATKWAVFWLLAIPGGLGMLWVLAREAPWSRRAVALPEPAAGHEWGRWTGGRTFLVVLVVSFVVVSFPYLWRTGG